MGRCVGTYYNPVSTMLEDEETRFGGPSPAGTGTGADAGAGSAPTTVLSALLACG